MYAKRSNRQLPTYIEKDYMDGTKSWSVPIGGFMQTEEMFGTELRTTIDDLNAEPELQKIGLSFFFQVVLSG